MRFDLIGLPRGNYRRAGADEAPDPFFVPSMFHSLKVKVLVTRLMVVK